MDTKGNFKVPALYKSIMTGYEFLYLSINISYNGMYSGLETSQGNAHLIMVKDDYPKNMEEELKLMDNYKSVSSGTHHNTNQ